MKVIEKLAQEYVEKSGDSTDASTWMDGFRKAREMAKGHCQTAIDLDDAFYQIEYMGEGEV